jgi:hypothetical protein
MNRQPIPASNAASPRRAATQRLGELQRQRDLTAEDERPTAPSAIPLPVSVHGELPATSVEPAQDILDAPPATSRSTVRPLLGDSQHGRQIDAQIRALPATS